MENHYTENLEKLIAAKKAVMDVARSGCVGSRTVGNLERAGDRIDKAIKVITALATIDTTRETRGEIRALLTNATPEQLEKVKSLLS